MKFRTARSLVFWMGIPGLLFLFWAWFDSTRFLSQADWAAGPGSWRIRHHQSALTITRAPEGSYFGFGNYWTRDEYATKDRLPAVGWAKAEIGRDPVGRRVLQLPHWLALSAYGAAWGVAIAWRRRHATKHREPG